MDDECGSTEVGGVDIEALREQLEAVAEELAEQRTLNAGLRGELRKYR